MNYFYKAFSCLEFLKGRERHTTQNYEAIDPLDFTRDETDNSDSDDEAFNDWVLEHPEGATSERQKFGTRKPSRSDNRRSANAPRLANSEAGPDIRACPPRAAPNNHDKFATMNQSGKQSRDLFSELDMEPMYISPMVSMVSHLRGVGKTPSVTDTASTATATPSSSGPSTAFSLQEKVLSISSILASSEDLNESSATSESWNVDLDIENDSAYAP